MLEVRPLRDAAELSALAELESYAFGVAPEHAARWLAGAGEGHVRVAEQASAAGPGRLVGGLLQIPMGQFVGGRSVPTLGIAGVAVAPEARGQGVGQALMRASLREAAGAGVALSTLYPATVTLYRSVGYEIAGSRMRFGARVADLVGLAAAGGRFGPGARDRALPVPRRELPEDEPAVHACYRRFAAHRSGWLDRGPYVWKRTLRHRSQLPAHRFVVATDAGLAGYLRLALVPNERMLLDLQVVDFAADHAGASAALVRLLADHRSTAEQVTWYGGLDDPILQLARERCFTAELHDWWMVRIVDVVTALEARGYPAGLGARLELVVADELLPANAGAFVVEVEAGRGRCRRATDGAGAGAPRVELDVRALGALFTGFATPRELRERGLLAGDDEALALAGALLPKAAPSMRDMF
ncbi:MAG: GNAT family N-acetyltransferase [Myxococcales bacterium]|nr:GNAT family N-acetyltransferase [Myxococcales bacterium]